MASTDSRPLAIKNTAYRVYFAIYKNDGTLITGAAGLDSEVSKDGAAYADCTNEATEIGSSGTYYLDLTSTEMNADNVMVVVKTSSTGAIIPTFSISPNETGDIDVDVTALLGTAWLTPGTAGTPDVNVKLWNGLTTVALPLAPTTAGRTLDVSAGGEAGVDWANVGSPTTVVGLSGTTVKTATDVETDTADIQTRLPAALVSGRMASDMIALSGDTVAADNAESFFDGTGYAGTGNVIPTVTNVTNLHASAATSAELAKVPKSDSNVTWNATALASLQQEATDALNAYDPPTKAELDAAVANVSVDEIQATALADLFNTDSGTTYASAVAGSVVKEIADNAGGSSLTAADIADAVWDEATAGHTTSGTFGEQLKTDVDAILADTNELQTDDYPGTLATLATAAALATVDTVVDAILVDTGTTLDAAIADLPTNAELATALGTADDAVLAAVATVDTVVDAIKVKTDSLTFTTAGMVDAAIKRVGNTTLNAAGTGGQGYGA